MFVCFGDRAVCYLLPRGDYKEVIQQCKYSTASTRLLHSPARPGRPPPSPLPPLVITPVSGIRSLVGMTPSY